MYRHSSRCVHPTQRSARKQQTNDTSPGSPFSRYVSVCVLVQNAQHQQNQVYTARTCAIVLYILCGVSEEGGDCEETRDMREARRLRVCMFVNMCLLVFLCSHPSHRPCMV